MIKVGLPRLCHTSLDASLVARVFCVRLCKALKRAKKFEMDSF
jgi:hypothetical protein